MSKKAVIFDLDGTLIDSLKDIALCMNEVLGEFSLDKYKIDEYKPFVGGGAEVLVRNALAKYECDEGQIKKALNRFKEIYDLGVHNNTKPYEGIYELLDSLDRDFHLAVLSNKPHKFTLAYVNKFFSDYNFLEIHGQKESVPKKPDPIAAINIAKSLGVNLNNTFFVGDSDVDMKTATNAKMVGVGVLWGFRGADELLENGAKYLAQDTKELLEILSL